MNFNIELNDAQIGNESLLIDGAVEDRLKGVPITTSVKQLISKLQPGDCICNSLSTQHIDTLPLYRRLFNKLSRIVQRTDLSHVDFVLSKHQIAGYVDDQFTTQSTVVYFKSLDDILVLRPITKPNMKKSEVVIQRRIGLNYNVVEVISSMFNRLFGISYFTENKVMQAIHNRVATSLICSSMVVDIYQQLGCSIKTNQHTADVWPVDLILSPSLKPIIQYKQKD